MTPGARIEIESRTQTVGDRYDLGELGHCDIIKEG